MENETPQWMKDHIESDHLFQKKFIEEILPTLATKDDVSKLATEQSVRDVVHWQRNILQAGEILSVGGKFGYKAILILATFLGALSVITGTWKTILVWTFAKLP